MVDTTHRSGIQRTDTTEPGVDRWLKGNEPDWDAIDFDLPCSRCGYELRMLTLPRCPECGLRFDWRDILDVRLRHDQFLFEYRWRKRPVRSYLATVTRALRPWRFWRSVSIHGRIHVGPLAFLLCSAPIVFLLLLHGGAAILALVCESVVDWAASRGFTLPATLNYARYPFGYITREPAELGWWFVLYPLGAICLSLLAATALLCLLRQTLGRCRVRVVQVLRVAAYAATPTCVVWALSVLVLVLIGLAEGGWMNWAGAPRVPMVHLWSPLVYGAYLAVGLGRYLRLPRPWLLGLTAAGVGLLFTMTVYAFGFVLCLEYL